jgi:hypothetical protein
VILMLCRGSTNLSEKNKSVQSRLRRDASVLSDIVKRRSFRANGMRSIALAFIRQRGADRIVLRATPTSRIVGPHPSVHGAKTSCWQCLTAMPSGRS